MHSDRFSGFGPSQSRNTSGISPGPFRQTCRFGCRPSAMHRSEVHLGDCGGSVHGSTEYRPSNAVGADSQVGGIDAAMLMSSQEPNTGSRRGRLRAASAKVSHLA